MLATDWGRIIFVASKSALLIPPEMIHYGMSKSAQLAVARGLAERTRGTRVTVNSVMPGPTRSEGIAAFVRSVVPDAELDDAARETAFFEQMRPLSLIRRLTSRKRSPPRWRCSPARSARSPTALRSAWRAGWSRRSHECFFKPGGRLMNRTSVAVAVTAGTILALRSHRSEAGGRSTPGACTPPEGLF